jgi:hypothetical protein
MEDRLLKNYETFQKVADTLRYERGHLIEMENVFQALFMVIGDDREYQWIADVWDIEIDEAELYELVKNFDFNSFTYGVETDVESIGDGVLYKTKVKIKRGGLIWIIHKNDFDPFPSRPHAHEVQQNLKLDLRNGDCYRVKKYVTTIHKKDLLYIRAEATTAKFELPELEL